LENTFSTLQRWLWGLTLTAVILAPSFREVDYKSYAVSVGFLLLFLLRALWFFKKPEIAFSPLESYLALYVGWTGLSYFWSPVGLAASEYLGRFLPCVGVYLLIRQEDKEREITSRIPIWTGLVFLLTLYGLLQKAGVDFIPAFSQNGSSTRIFATFGNPNIYAAFLVLAAPVLLLTGSKNKKIENVYVRAPLAVLILINLVLTASRGGFLAFFVEFMLVSLVLILRTDSQRQWRNWAGIFAFLLLLAGAFLTYEYGARPTSRLELWKGAFHMFLARPLQGWGIGQFPVNFQPYMTDVLSAQILRDNSFAEHAHNEVLELGVELGVVGLALAGLFWFRLLGRGIRGLFPRVLQNNDVWATVIGFTVGLLGLGISNLFDYNCRLSGISFFLWLSAGLLANRIFPADKIKLRAPLGVFVAVLLTGSAVFGLVQETRLLAAVLDENSQRDFLKEVPDNLSAEQQRLLEKIKIQPANPETYHELGNLFAKAGNLDGAQKAFEKELELNPNSEGAYLNLGNIFLLTSDKDPGRLELARGCYEKYIQLAPGKVDGHFDLAYVYFLRKDLKEALGQLDEVLKIDPQNAKALALKRQILP